MLYRCFMVFCALCLTLFCAGIAAAIPYYLTDLGPTGTNTGSWAYGVANINGNPVAVGTSITWGMGAANEPVVWTSTTPTSLLPSIPGAVAGHGSMGNVYGNSAYAINAGGDVVGETQIDGATRAFYLPSGGTATILPVLNPGSPRASAAGLSAGGSVVGNSTAGDGNLHAFVWSSATGMVDLGASGHASYATAISPDGNTIVGDIDNVPGQQGTAVKWTRSGSTWTQSIFAPSYNQSVALAINSSGDAVGSCFDSPPSVYQKALLFKHDGTVVVLGGLGNNTGYARGINDSGVIVGNDFTTAMVNYTGAPGANISLNSLLSPVSGAGWSVYYANGIDNAGDIVGLAKAPNTHFHGVLLKPAMLGDASLDATVDVNDLSKVLTNYDKTGMQWADGDFDANGTVDISDLGKVLTNYNKSVGASATGVKAVPEPSSLLLLVLAIAGLAAYRVRTK